MLQAGRMGCQSSRKTHQTHVDAKVYAFSPLDAFIEDRPALDRSAISTDRDDDTVLVILDPVAITDEHLFRWGEPPHTYKVKAIDGLLQDEETGTRYASEVVLIR